MPARFGQKPTVVEGGGGGPASATSIALERFAYRLRLVAEWLGSTPAGVSVREAPIELVMPAPRVGIHFAQVPEIEVAVSQRAGIRVDAATTILLTEGGRWATRIAEAPVDVVVEGGRAGVRADVLPVAGDLQVLPTQPGAKLSTVVSGDASIPDAPPGISIEELTWELTATRRGASAAATGTGWTNPTNANGAPNATNATFAANTLSTRSGTLNGQFDDFNDKDALTVDTAIVKWYFVLAGAVGSNATCNLQVSPDGAAWTTVAAHTANVNHSAAGQSTDVKALGYDTWAELNALRWRVNCASDLTESWTVNVDAVELVVTAST